MSKITVERGGGGRTNLRSHYAIAPASLWRFGTNVRW